MGLTFLAAFLAAKKPVRHQGPDIDWPFLIAGSVFLALVIIAMFADRAMRRRLQKRLGSQALGAIVWQTTRHLRNGSTRYVLKIKFRTARGGSYKFAVPSFKSREVGQKVVVHYLPGWPYAAEVERWSVPEGIRKIEDLPPAEPAPPPHFRDFGIPPPE